MTHRTQSRWPLALCVTAASLAGGCSIGPNYQRPKLDAPPAYKEAGDWKPSEPSDVLDRGNWWEIFQDDQLTQLESRIDISNQNVKAAADAFAQSRALVSQARAGFWPTIGASVSKLFAGAGSGSATVITNGGTGTGTGTGNATGSTGSSGVGVLRRSAITDTAGLSANWDIDIWGKVRRAAEGARATAQASAASLAGARLSAQAELATDYFELRAQDQLQKLLDDTVEAETQSLHITESRYKFGVAARADVVTAQTQLLASQAQQVNAKIQRGILEHAIAVLVGQMPSAFTVAPSAMRTDVPTVPAGVPSALLERRPDVAQFERDVAASNAQIGVAEAAYFPDLTLSGSDDYSSNTFRHLISLPNRVWSFGPTLAETLVDGGLRRAQVAAARAAHDVTVDNYRQTVLAAFQQVEDDIVTLRVLEQQSGIEDQTVAAAREAEKLTLNQYKAGTVPYSSVISAQTTRLSAEQTALSVLSQRLQTSVGLIEALGGGWKASDLPLP